MLQFTLPPAAVTNRDIGDLRFVHTLEPPPNIKVSTWQTFFYTDNVYNTPSDKRESTGWTGDVAIKVVPYSTSRWEPWIGADYFAFRYHRESPEDFDGQAIGIGSELILSQDEAWRWDLSYSLWRFTDARDRSDEFFKQGLLENYLIWSGRLSERPVLYSEIGYGVTFRHASPGRFDRVENELSMRLHYFPWTTVQITPFARVAIRAYLEDEEGEDHRNDIHFDGGLFATWDISRNFALRSEVTWTLNESNRSDEDYEVFEPQFSIYAAVGF